MPTAHAPSSTASSASSMRVRPQIFTRGVQAVMCRTVAGRRGGSEVARNAQPGDGDAGRRTKGVAVAAAGGLEDRPGGSRPVGLVEQHEASGAEEVDRVAAVVEGVVGALGGDAALAAGQLQPPDPLWTAGTR